MITDNTRTRKDILDTIETAANPKGISAKEITNIINSHIIGDQFSKADIMKVLTELVSDGILAYTFSKIKGKKLFTLLNTKRITPRGQITSEIVARTIIEINDAYHAEVGVDYLETIISIDEIEEMLSRLGYNVVHSEIYNIMYNFEEDDILYIDMARSDHYNSYCICDLAKLKKEANMLKQLTEPDVFAAITGLLSDPRNSNISALDVKTILRSEDFYATQEDVKFHLDMLVNKDILTKTYLPDRGYNVYDFSDTEKVNIIMGELDDSGATNVLTSEVKLVAGDNLDTYNELVDTLYDAEVLRMKILACQSPLNEAEVKITCNDVQQFTIKLSTLAFLLKMSVRKLKENVENSTVLYTIEDVTVTLDFEDK